MQKTKLVQKITKDMLIGDVIHNYPSVIEILLNNGIHCVGCQVSSFETLEEGFKGHGMTDKKIDNIVEQLNNAIPKQEMKKDFNITKTAAEKLKELSKKEGKEGHGLRVMIVKGGCAGYSYGLEFEPKAKKGDKIVHSNGIDVFIDKESLKFVEGIRLDYIDALQGGGFKITNPNAQTTCGCGQSFS